MDVLWRVRKEMKNDHATLIAAGVAFYAFFALFPTLFAVVAIYGLVADPADVQAQVSALEGVLPSGAQQIVGSQLRRVAGSSGTALGWGLVIGLLVALWSASKGVRGIVDALNIAYDETEDRGFFKRTGLVLLLTVGGIVTAVVAIALVVALPAVLNSIGLGVAGQVLAEVARWVLLAALVITGLAVLYRVAPARRSARWRWVTPGSALAAGVWLVASVLFSIYVDQFASYQKTFGSLAAVAVMLLWFWISALAIILGGEVNAEAERQTQRDTTRGPTEPMGRRGARSADTLGERAPTT